MKGTGKSNAAAAAALLLACVAAYGTRDVSAAVHLEFNTVPLSIQTGDTFTVEVNVPVAGAEFNAFDLNVSYDPARLTFVPTSPVSAQRGALMTAACANTFHQFTPLSGELRATLSLLCNSVFVTGPGVIYKVRFAATGVSGPTDISCAGGTQFYRAGFFVNPLDCVTRTIDVTGTSGTEASLAGRLRLEVPAAWGHSPWMTVRFDLPRGDDVTLDLFDVTGRRLDRRAPERFEAGRHELNWAVTRPASGIFIVRLTTGEGLTTRARWLSIR